MCFPSVLLLFLMIRRSPISTLFPYTTLFPSQAEDGIRDWSVTGVKTYTVFCLRSEEHRSELQSLSKLLFSLVLQKATALNNHRIQKRSGEPPFGVNILPHDVYTLMHACQLRV